MFNSDAGGRLAVAIDLVNAANDGALLDTHAGQPHWIFENHKFRSTTDAIEWGKLSDLADRLTSLIRLIVSAEHDIAVQYINEWLDRERVIPFLAGRDGVWSLHFHPPDASFAEGWSSGIAAALAINYSTASKPRIGICSARACDRIFLDEGKNQQRRFCGLKCQNRSKSLDYRRRRAVSRSDVS